MRQDTGPAEHLRFLNELYASCHRARPAALLPPDDVAAVAAEQYPGLRTRGWALQAVLSDEDIALMAEKSGAQPMRFSIIALDEGLPMCLLVTQVDDVQFRWVVPMWERGAMEWLRESIAMDRLLLLVESPTSAVGLTFLASGGLFGHPEHILLSAQPKTVDEGASALALVLGGMKLMAPDAVESPKGHAPPKDIRVMVAARGMNSVLLMETYQQAMHMSRGKTSAPGTELNHFPMQ